MKTCPPLADAVIAFVAAQPGCMCPDTYAGLPHISRHSLRSMLCRLAQIGRLATRGPVTFRRYYASQDIADVLWSATAVNATPPRRPGTHIRPMLQSYLCGRPDGSTARDMAAHFGCSEARACNVALAEMAAGRAFRCPISVGVGNLYFGEAAHLQAAQPRLAAETAAFRLEQQQAVKDYQRARIAVRVIAQREARKAAPKVPKPPKPPKPKRASLDKALTVLPKRAEHTALVKRGPAMLACEPNVSAAKVTRAPTPPGRFEVPADFRGSFSLAGIGRDVETGRAWAW